MEFNPLTVMAYLIVVITILTMLFGLIAYWLYKMREAKHAKHKQLTSEEHQRAEAEKEKFLFFEHKEIVL